MKIRSGFVSNSSTASYVIMGVHYDSDEELRKIVEVILGQEPTEPKPKLTLFQKKEAVIAEWNEMHDKPKEYYQWKCDELPEDRFESLHEKIFGPEDEDEDLWELLEDLYNTEWVAETQYEKVIGYQLVYSHSDGNSECVKLDLNEMKKKMEYIEKISGKTPELIAYVTEG